MTAPPPAAGDDRPHEGRSLLLISPYPPWRTGPSEYAATFSRECARRGFRVTVLTEELPDPSPVPPEGVRVVRGWRRGFRQAFSVLRAGRSAPGDVIHVNYSFTMYGGPVESGTMLLALARLARRRPMLVTVFDILSKREFTRETLALYQVRTPPFLARLAVRWVLRFLSKVAAKIVVQSPAVAETLVQDFGVPRERIALTPLPAYAPQEAPRPTFAPARRPSRAAKRVLFYGFIAPYKGIEVLLDAYQRARTALPSGSLKLVVAGANHPRLSYDYRSDLAGAAQRLGIPSEEVEFPGYLETPDSERLIAASDLVVLPYLRATGSSGALASAMGAGRPVVVTSLSPLVHQLDGYPAARIVPPGEAGPIAEAIEETARGRLTPRAPAELPRAHPPLRWSDLVDQTARLYDEALIARGPEHGARLLGSKDSRWEPNLPA